MVKAEGNRRYFGKGPSTEIHSGNSQKGIPISWYDRIRIRYQFTFSKKESKLPEEVEKDDFMQSLQLRWRKFGYLPVDGDGGFSIISEELRKN